MTIDRKYKKNKLREELVRTILKSSEPKTTEDMAVEVRYQSKSKNLNRPTKKLCEKKIFYRIPKWDKEKRRYSDAYDFVYNRDSIKKTLKIFPSLISDLQTNDKVLTELIKGVNPETPFKKDLKHKLMTSSLIFKNFVYHTSNELNAIYSLQFQDFALNLISDIKCNEFEHYIMEKLQIEEFDIINRNTILYLFLTGNINRGIVKYQGDKLSKQDDINFASIVSKALKEQLERNKKCK